MAVTSTAVTLASRPQGEPKLTDFKIVEKPLRELKDGEVLLKTQYISLDPYQRGRMSDRKSYAKGLEIGDVIVSSTISEVVESRYEGLAKGDIVLAFVSGWQTYDILQGSMVRKLGADITHPSWSLGVLGMPGLTAWYGLVQIGKPKKGETLVVGAAAGPVGSTVGQLAKSRGLRAVGIAGGKEKCEHVVRDLGFDACIDHKSPDFAEQLAKACPNGIDIYFENIGGRTLRAVFPLMNKFGRIPLCGLVSGYNNEMASTADHDELPMFLGGLLANSITIEGFIVRDHFDQFNEFYKEVVPLIKEGKLKYFEDVTAGLENAPATFIGMLNGKNKAKAVIKIVE